MARSTKAQIAANLAAANAAKAKALAELPGIALAEGMSRAKTIAALKSAVGELPIGFNWATADKANPTRKSIDLAIRQAMAGRMASAFPSNEPDATRIANAFIMLNNANADGTGKLRAGQLGRRTVGQEAAYKAAKEYARQLRADCGFTLALTTAEKNSRKPRTVDTKKAANDDKGAKPNAADIKPKPVKVTPTTFRQHIEVQSAALLAYCDKHAKHDTMGYASSVHIFKLAIDEARKAFEARPA